MAITAEITKQPKSSIKLDITIEAKDVNEAFNAAYEDLVKKVKVKGFRPGKVPVGIIKMKYGNAVSHEVLDKLLNSSFREVAQKNELQPVSRGNIVGELPDIKEDAEYKFSMEVDVYPEFELPEYKEIPITKDSYEVKPADIEKEVESFRKRFAEIKDKEEGVIDKDSLAAISYEVEFNGEMLDNLKRENYSYDMSAAPSFPDLKKSLIGKKAGDSVDVKSSFPKDFPDAEKAGKSVVFKVVVSKVQEMVLPELDDEFAKKVSGQDTVEKFREMVENHMKEHATTTESRNVQNEIIKYLTEKVKIETPESMIESEIDSILANFKNTLLYSRSTFEKYLEETGKTEEEMREESRESAVTQVKTFLVLNEISKKEKIEPEANEINEEIQQLAMRYGQPLDKMREHLLQSGEVDTIAFGIRRRKTLSFLEEAAKIKAGKKLSYQDISK